MQNDSLLTEFQEFLARIKETPAGTLFARGDELRSRLLKVTVLFFIVFLGVFSFAKALFAVLKVPLIDALPVGQANLHFTSPLEVFLSYMKVGFLAAAAATAPFAFVQLWRFIAPALPERQRRHVAPFFVIALLLFFGGCAFCYFVILPPALKILIGMGGDVAAPLITVEEYISLVVMMMLAFGAVFQLPLVLIILERLGVVSGDTLAKNRAGMLIGILVVAAVVTPTPDPFSQVAMAAPMYLMFEAAILVIRWLEKTDRHATVKA